MAKRSPFPGMDPYLERRWGDVQVGLCVVIRAALQPDLPVGVRAVAQEAFHIAPLRRWVEIIDATDHDRVVTAIEVLSPGNKAAGGLNREYVRKVLAYLDAGVNVVEIDLLRSTRDRLLVPDADLPAERRAAYYTCVNRAADPGLWKVYPMPLRQPLPTVPVPLRATDRDVGLALQPLLDRVYLDGGRYYTDYRVPPPRPLSADDAAWAAGLVAG